MSQLVMPESHVPTILHLVRDDVLADHPGRERTLIAARKKYYWTSIHMSQNV